MDKTFQQAEEISFSAGLTLFSGKKILEESFFQNGKNILKKYKGAFSHSLQELPLQEKGFRRLELALRVDESTQEAGRFFFSALLPAFQKEWFIFIPSSCYAGNDFVLVKEECYPPKYMVHYTPEDPLHPPVAMLEVPSVGKDKLFNRSVTDGSSPLIGVFMPEKKQAFFLAFEQGTSLGNNGIEISVTAENSLRLLLSLPCVRRESFTKCKNLDEAPILKKGEKIHLSLQTTLQPAEDLADFYRIFSEIRSSFPQQEPYKNSRSFSHAQEILLKMFSQVRYIEEHAFFTKARGQLNLNTGWCSYGEIVSLYQFGDEKLKKAVFAFLENIFHNAFSSNFFPFTAAKVVDGHLVFMPYDFPLKTEKGSTLMRLPAEFLFHTLKLFLLWEEKKISYPAKWKLLLESVAENLLILYEKYGQLGHIVNLPDGEMVLGGSFTAAIAPAALLLAGKYYKKEKYSVAGEKILQDYVEEFRQKGFTYGGPGDSMFAPDSESASALLLSLVLYCEKYSGKKYLEEARYCADYFASWVPSVKYTFPKGSTLDLMDADCRGAVQANLQNQHGAPAPCVDPANSLLLLYQLSGQKKYLQLLQEIIHNCVQYISTKAHPIPMQIGGVMPQGDICEKVFFQDYCNKCGMIPFGSGGWTEIAVLMCISENPGIYCDIRKDLLMVFDHVEAALADGILTIINPFSYPVNVQLLTEKASATSGEKNLPSILPFLQYETISIEANGTVSIDLKEGTK